MFRVFRLWLCLPLLTLSCSCSGDSETQSRKKVKTSSHSSVNDAEKLQYLWAKDTESVAMYVPVSVMDCMKNARQRRPLNYEALALWKYVAPDGAGEMASWERQGIGQELALSLECNQLYQVSEILKRNELEVGTYSLLARLNGERASSVIHAFSTKCQDLHTEQPPKGLVVICVSDNQGVHPAFAADSLGQSEGTLRVFAKKIPKVDIAQGWSSVT